MPMGKGKYDDTATQVRNELNADGVALIVLGGADGNGFSVQMSLPSMLRLPDMLEQMAKQIRQDLQG